MPSSKLTVALLLALLAIVPSLYAQSRSSETPERSRLFAELSESERSRVERGQVAVRVSRAPGASVGDLSVVGYVDAPSSRLWTLLLSPAEQMAVYPELLEMRNEGVQGGLLRQYSLLAYPWPFENRHVVNLVTIMPEQQRIEWRRIEGTIRESRGFWQLYPEGERTLIHYRIRFDPGIDRIPDSLIDWLSRRVSPDMILKIRDYLARRG